jgi:LPXTG-motif cell wall-anchored protein
MSPRSRRSFVALAGGVAASALLAGAFLAAPPAGAYPSFPAPSSPTATPNPVATGSGVLLTWDCGPSLYLAGSSVRVIGVGTGEEVTANMSGSGMPPVSYSTTVPVPAGWTPGTGSVEYKCTYSYGDDVYNPTESLPLTIVAPPTFTDEAIGALVAGTAFSDGVEAGGSPTLVYEVTAGALPVGLVLDPATGAITGTPTTPGPYAFTVTATNDWGTDVAVLSGVIGSTGVGPSFTDAAVANMTVGVASADGVAAVGDPAPTYALTEGTLPPGLTLDAATGALVGTPTTPGQYGFTIAAANEVGTVSAPLVVVVAAPPSAPPENDGVLDVSVVALNPAGTTTLVATGYKPGTEVAFVIYSEPLMLGTAIADGNGVATLVATLPADFPTGGHTVVSLGEDALGGDRVMSQQVTVSTDAPTPTSTTTPEPELPRTGASTVPAVVLGSLLLAGGGFLVIRGRRLVG